MGYVVPKMAICKDHLARQLSDIDEVEETMPLSLVEQTKRDAGRSIFEPAKFKSKE